MARCNGLVNTLAKVTPRSRFSSRRALRSPRSVSGRSVSPVCWPERVQAVSRAWPGKRPEALRSSVHTSVLSRRSCTATPSIEINLVRQCLCYFSNCSYGKTHLGHDHARCWKFDDRLECAKLVELSFYDLVEKRFVKRNWPTPRQVARSRHLLAPSHGVKILKFCPTIL